MKQIPMVFTFFLFLSSAVLADQAKIEDVRVHKTVDGVYRFDVTLRHADTGWDHYADKWEVLGPDGQIYATRVLLHPHMEEQPFTRSLGNVRVPAGVKSVSIRAHDSRHGYSAALYKLSLP